MELLNRDKTGLQIFDNFIIDKKLPKHQTGMKARLSEESGDKMSGVGGSMNWDSDLATPQASWTISPGEAGSGAFIVQTSNGTQLKIPRWKRWLLGIGKEKKVVYRYTAEEFFKSIKNSTTELKRIDERIESFDAILKQAQDFGQVALVENMQDQIKVIKSETQLYAIKLTTVIVEEQVVKFAKDSERGLHLDWIKNFTRVIPSKLLKVKAKADELKIFDNYVILHYDPKGKSTQLTKKEIEKKKDPILFGVIFGSRKLYYIGDWIDEHCDLTLDAFIDKFGKESINQNNITANIKAEV